MQLNHFQETFTGRTIPPATVLFDDDKSGNGTGSGSGAGGGKGTSLGGEFETGNSGTKRRDDAASSKSPSSD